MSAVMPPPLFDLEPTSHLDPDRGPLAYVLMPFDGAFVSWKDRLCSGCHKRLRNLSCTHSCGGARDGGNFDLCDHCAANDWTPDGLPRWGITTTSLAMEQLRRKVYATGGGEHELRAAYVDSGLAARWEAEQTEFTRIRQQRVAA